MIRVAMYICVAFTCKDDPSRKCDLYIYKEIFVFWALYIYMCIYIQNLYMGFRGLGPKVFSFIINIIYTYMRESSIATGYENGQEFS